MHFPRPKEPGYIDTIMATLKDLISDSLVDALQNAKVLPQKYVNIPDDGRRHVTFFQEKLGQELDRYFWECLDLNLKTSYTGVVVGMRGKHEREILTVTYEAWWAKHLGYMLKEGWTLIWINKYFTEYVSWDNWKEIYQRLTRKPDTRPYEEQLTRSEALDILENRRRDRLFYDLAKPIRMKKGQKAVSLEESNLQRVRSERAGKQSKTVFRAKQILSII